MDRRVRELAASVLLLTIVGYVCWPWRGGESLTWYTYLPEFLQGDLAILGIAMGVTVAVGFVTVTVGGIRLSSLAIAGVLTYGFWMAVLTAAFSLHDPLAYIVYGQVLVGVLLGAGLATVFHRVSASTISG